MEFTVPRRPTNGLPQGHLALNSRGRVRASQDVVGEVNGISSNCEQGLNKGINDNHIINEDKVNWATNSFSSYKYPGADCKISVVL